MQSIDTSQRMAPAMALALAGSLGSVEGWRAEFVAQARRASTGRVLLSFLAQRGVLVNRHVAEFAQDDEDHVTLLAFDAGEGADAVRFVADIDWDAVYERYQHAVHAASEAFAVSRDELGEAVLLDVRRAGMFKQADSLIPGAAWRDPAKVDEWAAELPPGREVVVYCVYGHEVGRSTALRLRSRGIEARFLEGGIDGWRSAGAPLQAKGDVS